MNFADHFIFFVANISGVAIASVGVIAFIMSAFWIVEAFVNHSAKKVPHIAGAIAVAVFLVAVGLAIIKTNTF